MAKRIQKECRKSKIADNKTVKFCNSIDFESAIHEGVSLRNRYAARGVEGKDEDQFKSGLPSVVPERSSKPAKEVKLFEERCEFRLSSIHFAQHGVESFEIELSASCPFLE